MARRPRVPQTIPNAGPARIAELRRRVRELRQIAASLRQQGLDADAAYYEREQRAALRRLYGIQGGGAQARNAIVRNAQRAAASPALGHQGRQAAARARGRLPTSGTLPPGPGTRHYTGQPVTTTPPSASGPPTWGNPSSNPFNGPITLPISSTFSSVQSYLSTGPWQPPIGGALPALPPPGPGPGPFPHNAPTTQPLPTLPTGPGTATATLPGATPGGGAPGGPGSNPPPNPSAPTPVQKRLQHSVDAIRVRLDQLSRFVEGHAPTPGDLAPLLWILLVLLVAIVPVNANGATRLKLLWYTLTGNAWLPSVAYGGAAGQGSGGDTQAPSGDTSAIYQPPPGGVGGLGVFGSGAPVRVPTSLPLGGGAGLDAVRPLRFPGRATQHGGQHSRVAGIARTGLNVHNGGVRITPPAADQGANPAPYAPQSPQAPLIFPPGRPRLSARRPGQ